MKELTIQAEEPAFVRVLGDLLRVYFPGIMVYAYEGHSKGFPLLIIEKLREKSGFRLTWHDGGKVFTHEELPGMEEFFEEEINRERRILRLALHHLLSDELGVAPSSWGVLTGVRPIKIVHRLIEQGFVPESIENCLVYDYGIRRDKAVLVTKTALNQRRWLLTKEEAERQISLYIGIPFCPTRCHYCSFPSYSLEKSGRHFDDYLHALHLELEKTGEALKESGIAIQTVYLGGGTPTILSVGQLDQLLQVIAASFNLNQTREITVEGGRPDTLDRAKMEVLKSHGVTRLSINPQTMNDGTLQIIGRRHSAEQIIEAYREARECGIPFINMDLIIGLPGEDAALLGKTLKTVLALRPDNITLHALAIKRAAYYRQAGVELPSQKEGEAMSALARQELETHGYIPYYLYRQKEILAHGENVGYTLPGAECNYNIQMIEERQTVLGFGVGAGSKIIRTSDWAVDNFYNPKDLLLYLARLDEIVQRKVDKVRAFLYNN